MVQYRIPNPFIGGDGYHCFACAPQNEIGLKLTFHREDDSVSAVWQPSTQYQGYTGIVHGGIQATLLDEVGSWTMFALLGEAGVTHSLSIEYQKPLAIDSDTVVATARITHASKRSATVSALLKKGNQVTTTATIRFRIIPQRVAKYQFNFPGKIAFIPNKTLIIEKEEEKDES